MLPESSVTYQAYGPAIPAWIRFPWALSFQRYPLFSIALPTEYINIELADGSSIMHDKFAVLRKLKGMLSLKINYLQWRIQGAPPARAPPTGPDSFILTYKIFEM